MKLVYYLFFIGIGATLFAAILWQIDGKKTLFFSSLSPIPNFLVLSQNNQVRLMDFWLPLIGRIENNTIVPPDISAKSVLIYDLTTNKTIFERDSKQHRAMASLTKI